MTISNQIVDLTWSIFAIAAISSVWIWAVTGWKQLAYSNYCKIIRGRNVAASFALGFLAIIIGLSLPILPKLLINSAFAGFFSGVAICLHNALDPIKEGFWHHKRLKYIVTALILAGTTILGEAFPMPIIVPIASAAVIFHRHHLIRVKMLNQCLDDIQSLQSKLLTYETQSKQDSLLSESLDDKISRAS